VELINLTSFAAERSISLDPQGRECLLVLVKASYALDTGQPVLSEQQDPLHLADVYHGEPGVTSLRWAAETCLYKPAAEVVVTGAAYTRASARDEALVSVRVGSVHKRVRVVGDRTWRGRSRGTLSAPKPFREMPLLYERAFGGSDATGKRPQACAENPVGAGYRSEGSQLSLEDCAAPNLEDLTHDSGSDRAKTCGLGPVAPSWAPRARHAGTYDAAWRKQRMPLLPDDFDPRFAFTAPADQILSGYLTGGEPVQLDMLRPDGGSYTFALPALAAQVVVSSSGQRLVPELRCDTLHIDTTLRRMWLTARASLNVHERLSELAWIKIERGAHGKG
jgi:hypothetical protein